MGLCWWEAAPQLVDKGQGKGSEDSAGALRALVSRQRLPHEALHTLPPPICTPPAPLASSERASWPRMPPPLRGRSWGEPPAGSLGSPLEGGRRLGARDRGGGSFIYQEHWAGTGKGEA